MIKKVLLRYAYKLGLMLISGRLREESKTKSRYLYERSIEYSFALKHLCAHKALDVLDVGTGTNSFASTLRHCGYNVTASDLKGGYWSLYQNRHIHVEQDDITSTRFPAESFDAINCISTLEHIPDYESALKNIVAVTKPGGLIILTFPYSSDCFCDNVYKLDIADSLAKNFQYIARSYSDNEIRDWCERYDLEIREMQYIRGWEGKFWRSGARIDFPYIVEEPGSANCICLALVKTVR